MRLRANAGHGRRKENTRCGQVWDPLHEEITESICASEPLMSVQKLIFVVDDEHVITRTLCLTCNAPAMRQRCSWMRRLL